MASDCKLEALALMAIQRLRMDMWEFIALDVQQVVEWAPGIMPG